MGACVKKWPLFLAFAADNQHHTDKTMKGTAMYTSPSSRMSGASAYQQVGVNSQVMGASPHGLISLLFAELRKCLVGAKAAMQSKDVPVKVRLMAKSARLIDEGFDFDLIDAHYYYPDGVAAAILARKLGKPFVVTARGTDLNLIPQYAYPRRLIVETADQAAASIGVCRALIPLKTQCRAL